MLIIVVQALLASVNSRLDSGFDLDWAIKFRFRCLTHKLSVWAADANKYIWDYQ